MPPPTGVVSGPLIPTKYSRNASTVSSGSQLSNLSFAAWPGKTSNHAIFLFPAISFFDRSIKDALARGPYIGASAIAANKRDHRLVRDIQCLTSCDLVS